MASLSSRVRAFSTASRGFLKLKHDQYSHKLAVSSHQRSHMVSSHPKGGPSPALFGSFTTTRRFLSTASNPDNSEAKEESELEEETEPIEYYEYDHPYMCGDPTLFELSENNDAVKLRMDMPGVDKKGVKTWVDNESLHVRGVEAEGREYNYTYHMTSEDTILLKLKEANAEMKNGVFRVCIPKVTLEDRKTTINIPIK